MDIKFSKDDTENLQTKVEGEKKSQRAILLLLLLLLCAFLYLYFFTGIIKPQETPKPVEAPVKSQMVKMPLPPQPTDAGPGKAEAKPAEPKKDAAAPVKQPPITPITPITPVTPKTPVTPITPKTPKTPKTPVTPKEEPKKVAAAKPADKKPTVVEKKPEPARSDVKKAAAESPPKPKNIAKPEKPVKVESGSTDSGNTWSIQVGIYVLEDALSNDMGRLRKAGLVPVITPGSRKKIAMNRLFLSEFSDRADAMAAMEKLKRHTSDAFILDHGGKHALYAGSYLLDARAASEIERLGAAGFKVSLKRADVAIPSQSLSVGPFSDKSAAEAALKKLNTAGIKAVISKQ